MRARMCVIVCSMAVCVGASPALASPLVYQPVNPNFGGSPLNGPQLLNEAQAQKNFTDASSALADTLNKALTPSEQFAATIQSRLLSALADKITNAVFGSNPQDSGTFTVQGTTISFEHDGDNVILTVFDGFNTTTITLPSNF